MNSYFICATQYSNLGDLMINKMLIDELCKYGKVYIDATGVPDDFKYPLLENKNAEDVDKFGFSAKRLSISNILRFIKFIIRNEVRIITRSPGPLCDSSIKIRLGFSLINLLSRVCGAKVFYFGNCCSQAMMNKEPLHSTYVNSVFVRSRQSVDYAKKYMNCQVSYIPDMAYLMNSERVYNKKKKVIIDYRPLFNEKDKAISDLKSIVHDFRDHGFEVELYYQVKTDKEETFSLYEQLKGEGVSIRKKVLWYNEIESYYSDKAFVVSNRLHSLLFGAVYGVIPIARLSNDAKVAKILHVFQSSLPDIFSRSIMVEKPFYAHDFISKETKLRENLMLFMKTNKQLCSDVIYDICSK